MPYQMFTVPRTILHGIGAVQGLATVPGKRALIVTDPGVRDLGLVERVETILRRHGVETLVFDRVEPDPPKEVAWTLFSMAQEFKPDLFVGLGGGSSIDTGKAAWLLYENPDLAGLPFLEFLQQAPTRELRKKARYVAIPTTSGTGSEVTRVAVLVDRDVNPPFKAGFGSPHLVPDVAIADPELAVAMPPVVTANTGFDALVHAVECYVVGVPSDLTDPLAIWSAKTILEWLPRAVENGHDLNAREKMHLSSLQAGIAFSNAGLGLVHGTAHWIGATFRIAHGRSNAFMLCPTFAFVYPVRKERMVGLANALGISGRGDRGKVENLLVAFDELKTKIGIPLAIRDSGLEESAFLSQVEALAAAIIAQANRNPSLASLSPQERRKRGMLGDEADAKQVLVQAWQGTRAAAVEQRFSGHQGLFAQDY